MNKKTKSQTVPLQTIKQNPGNQESFIINSDSNGPNSHPFDSSSNSLPIQPEKVSKEKSSQPSEPSKQLEGKVDSNKGKKKKTKTKTEAERPKINMSSKALEQDIKIIQEHHEYTTSQMLAQFRQQKWSEQNIEMFLKIVNESHKKTLDKITRSIKIIPGLYSQEIVPVEIAYTNQLPRFNDMTVQNFKRACDRVDVEKTQRKLVNFAPKIPEKVDILLKDGSVMSVEDYLREKGMNPELERVEDTVAELEEHCIETQKKFIETVDLHDLTVKELEEELNPPNPNARSIKKRESMIQASQKAQKL